VELDLLQFQISKTGSSGGVIPPALPAIIKFQEADITETRYWSFDAVHRVNDAIYDMNRIDVHVPFGK